MSGGSPERTVRCEAGTKAKLSGQDSFSFSSRAERKKLATVAEMAVRQADRDGGRYVNQYPNGARIMNAYKEPPPPPSARTRITKKRDSSNDEFVPARNSCGVTAKIRIKLILISVVRHWMLCTQRRGVEEREPNEWRGKSCETAGHALNSQGITNSPLTHKSP